MPDAPLKQPLRAGILLGPDAPWVVALGEVIDPDPAAAVVELRRGGLRWSMPRELNDARQHFLKPVTVSSGRAALVHRWPGESLEELVEGHILWLSPSGLHADGWQDELLAGVRLIPHGRSLERDASGTVWWVVDEAGRKSPTSAPQISTWLASHMSGSLAAAAEIAAKEMGAPLELVRGWLPTAVESLLCTGLAHLDLAT